jgi:hypothetical protein
MSIFAAHDQTQHNYTHIFNTGAKDKDQSVSSENKSLSSCHTHIYGPSEILHELKNLLLRTSKLFSFISVFKKNAC